MNALKRPVIHLVFAFATYQVYANYLGKAQRLENPTGVNLMLVRSAQLARSLKKEYLERMLDIRK